MTDIYNKVNGEDYWCIFHMIRTAPAPEIFIVALTQAKHMQLLYGI